MKHELNTEAKTMVNLIRNMWAHYRSFIHHPEFRGPNFNWLVPARLSWVNWRATLSGTMPWDKN
jgi:hypothetical protein